MAGQWCFVCEHAGALCTCDCPTWGDPRAKRRLPVVEVDALFVLELARDLHGREVLVPRLPDWAVSS
jgi:hypothetical protein